MAISSPLNLDATLVSKALAHAGVKLNGINVVDEVASTNSEFVRAIAATRSGESTFSDSESQRWSAPALLVAVNQTQGRGRLGREWITHPGTSLTFSLHLEVDVPADQFTWLPQIVGVAVVKALRSLTGLEAKLKWPNDIVVDVGQDEVQGWATLRKVGGVLIERVGARSVVIGIGINFAQSHDQLPVEWATSLSLLRGEEIAATELLAKIVREVAEEVSVWEAAQGDVYSTGQKVAIEQLSATIGAHVNVENFDGSVTQGVASGLLSDGSLEIREISGEKKAVMVGDVGHLRLG